MEEYTEIPLENGNTLRVVDIPTMLIMDAMRHYPELEYPEKPGQVDVPTRVGIEHRPARKGDSIYDEWQAKTNEVDKLRDQFLQDFPWEVGVISWKLKDGKKFIIQPPKGWKVPGRYEKFGTPFSPLLDVRRLQYVRYVVIASIIEFNKTWRIINSGMLISQSEVDDAVAMFPGDEKTPTVA